MTLDSVERSSQGYAGCREECKSPMLDVTRRAFEGETLLRPYHGRAAARQACRGVPYEHGRDGILTIDESGLIEYVNPAISQIFGFVF